MKDKMKKNNWAKILTDENTPREILHIMSCSVSNIPVGLTFYHNTIKKYPEYFTKAEIKTVEEFDKIPKLKAEDFHRYFDVEYTDGIIKQIEKLKDEKE